MKNKKPEFQNSGNSEKLTGVNSLENLRLKVASIFSGIGAFEEALHQMGIGYLYIKVPKATSDLKVA